MGVRCTVILATLLSLCWQMYEYKTNADNTPENVIYKSANPFIELIWTCAIVLFVGRFEVQISGAGDIFQFIIDLCMSIFIMLAVRTLLWQSAVNYVFLELIPDLTFPILKNKTGLKEETIEQFYVVSVITILCLFLIYIFSSNKTIYEFDVGLGEDERPLSRLREPIQGQGDLNRYAAQLPIHEPLQEEAEVRELFGPPNSPGRRRKARYQPHTIRRSQRRRSTPTPSPEL